MLAWSFSAYDPERTSDLISFRGPYDALFLQHSAKFGWEAGNTQATGVLLTSNFHPLTHAELYLVGLP